MKKIIIAAALVAAGCQAQPIITDVHYDCESVHQVTVGFGSITVDGVQSDRIRSIPAELEKPDGKIINTTATVYEGGWIFARGATAKSGLLGTENTFFYCSATEK